MRITSSTIVHAPTDAVWDWWTDYGEPGKDEPVKHGMGETKRRVIERHNGTITLEERLPLFGAKLIRHTVHLNPESRTFREIAPPPAAYEAIWTFDAVPEGTRVTRILDTKAWWAKGPAAKVAERLIERDLRHHAKEAERDLGARGPR